MNKKDVLSSLAVALVFALVRHIGASRRYAEAFPAHASLMPLKPLMLFLYFALVFVAVFLTLTYKAKGLISVMAVLLAGVMILRMEGRAYLEFLGYREISVGLISEECGTHYDPGVNFSAIDPYSNLPVDGFACWSDFTTWQANYYTGK